MSLTVSWRKIAFSLLHWSNWKERLFSNYLMYVLCLRTVTHSWNKAAKQIKLKNNLFIICIMWSDFQHQFFNLKTSQTVRVSWLMLPVFFNSLTESWNCFSTGTNGPPWLTHPLCFLQKRSNPHEGITSALMLCLRCFGPSTLASVFVSV